MNDSKSEALVKAANAADPDLVRDLVAHGAPVDARNKTGWTPLMAVANKGQFELVQYLVEQGADVNAKNENGWTPVLLATLKGIPEIVRYLAGRGASARSAPPRADSPIDRTSSFGGSRPHGANSGSHL